MYTLVYTNLPMVAICVNLERSFTSSAIMTEQFLKGDDSSDR